MSIYMIKCKTSEDCYIGSTTNIKRRIQEHKYLTKNLTKKGMPVHRFLRDNGGWDNFEFSILEENCDNLRETEQAYIETIESTLNANRASIDKKTFLEQRIKAWHKKRENPEVKKEMDRIQRIAVDKWRFANPDIVKKYKDKYNKLAFTCECGEENVNRNHMSRHRSSEKHKKNVLMNTHGTEGS